MYKELKEQIGYIKRCIASYERADEETKKAILYGLQERFSTHLDGGSGSGNWGHVGIPPMRGGSAPGGGLKFRGGSSSEGFVQSQKNVSSKPDKNGQRWTVENGKRVKVNSSKPDLKDRAAYDSYMSQKKGELKTAKAAYRGYNGSDPNEESRLLAEVHKVGKDLDNATLTHFSSLSDCKTTADVQEYLRANRVFTESKTGSQRCDLTGMDVNVARATAETFLKICDELPEMKGHLGGITPGKLGKNVYACCNMASGKIEFNSNKYGDESKLKASYDRDVKLSWHPQGTDYRSIITHEAGHAIDSYISSKKYGFLSGKHVSHDILKDVKTMTGAKKMYDVQKNISNYATKNNPEFMAEGFAEALDSKTPRAEAQAVMTCIKNELANI